MPLDPVVKMLLDQIAETGGPTLREAGVEQGREMLQMMAMMEGDPVEVERVEPLTVAGTTPARLYASTNDQSLAIVVCRRTLCVSTTGVSPVTVIVSATAPILMSTLTGAVNDPVSSSDL